MWSGELVKRDWGYVCLCVCVRKKERGRARDSVGVDDALKTTSHHMEAFDPNTVLSFLTSENPYRPRLQAELSRTNGS